MRKFRKSILALLAAVIMTAAICSPALAYVSQYDSNYMSSSQQRKIASYTTDYNKAKAAGDTAGMAAAHSAAESVRATASYSGGTDGSEYHPWSRGSGSSSGSGGRSNYVPTTYSIAASAGTGGRISPSGSATVTSGKSQAYSITANSGYKISDVKVDGSSVGASSVYTFSSVTSAHTISATFASAATLSAGNVTLGDGGSGTLKSGTTKSGYGITANLPVTASYVSGTTVTASYNFISAKTISLEYVNGTWQFPVNAFSATGARKIYIPVETKDGTYKITVTIKALDPQATALTGSNVYLSSTKNVTLTVKGNMYEDDFTGDS